MQPGRTVGHYTILSRIGSGGMGEVYLAEDNRLERRVALKLLPEDFTQDAERRKRFFNEAKAASALNHPNICVIHDVGETEDHHLYLAMEHVPGRTLDAEAEDRPLPTGRVVEIVLQIADALGAAHAKGIVHRDIKPSNVAFDERGRVKVLDFGLAKRSGLETALTGESGSDLLTRPGQVLGTPEYMSPEQALGKETDGRSDLFSLGALMYRLVTGRNPFTGVSVGEVITNILQSQPEAIARFNYEVPAELERIIRKALQKEPARRYQTMQDLTLDLAQLQEELVQGREPHAAQTAKDLPAGAPIAASATIGLTEAAPAISESDIFINYANLDDAPLTPGHRGWISELHRNLEVRVAQLSGEPVKISAVASRTDDEQADEPTLRHLPEVKALVSVVSPPFLKSRNCHRRVEKFWDEAERAGKLQVEDKTRVLNVVKTPVDPADLPASLEPIFSRLTSFSFYEHDHETGRIREFDETFGPLAQQRYHERVYDVAFEICQILKRLKAIESAGQLTSAPSTGKTVFLALTTSDLQPQRDRLLRELVEQGHIVLPNQALPMVASSLEKAICGILEQCDLAIHLVGDRYGLVPEDSDLSIVALQNRFAADRSRSARLERFVWLPRGLKPRDERQAAFVRQLTRDHDTHHGAEVIADSLENFKEMVQEQLRPKPERTAPVAMPPGIAGPRRLYLICDSEDEAAVEPLEDFFFSQGVEVSLPDFESEESKSQELHVQNLQDCDAVLIYYGAAGKSWVDIKLRELTKAMGYRGGRAISEQAVYVAPPFDRRKERFKTLSATVFHQPAESFETETLMTFVNRVKPA